MTVVVDVGCARYGGDESIPYLIEEFNPESLFGFDPQATPAVYRVGDTQVVVASEAAWTHDRGMWFTGQGLGGTVTAEGGRGARRVDTIDLAALLHDIAPLHDKLVLKMDAEGAEYELVPHLIDRGIDTLLELMWIEWHCQACGRGGGGHRPGCLDTLTKKWEARRDELEAQARCEMHRWNR